MFTLTLQNQVHPIKLETSKHTIFTSTLNQEPVIFSRIQIYKQDLKSSYHPFLIFVRHPGFYSSSKLDLIQLIPCSYLLHGNDCLPSGSLLWDGVIMATLFRKIDEQQLLQLYPANSVIVKDILDRLLVNE